jgi:hypothetical protein
MVCLLIGLKIGVIAYGRMRPHVMRWRRNMEFFNESCVMLVAYSCICMTEFNENDSSVFYIGYQFMGFVGFLVSINFSIQAFNINENRKVKLAAEHKK